MLISLLPFDKQNFIPKLSNLYFISEIIRTMKETTFKKPRTGPTKDPLSFIASKESEPRRSSRIKQLAQVKASKADNKTATHRGDARPTQKNIGASSKQRASPRRTALAEVDAQLTPAARKQVIGAVERTIRSSKIIIS